MSNKIQLQTNNTDLDALIARVNAAKDTAASLPDAGGGGSGGGGSAETCTVQISGDNDGMVHYTSYTNGQISSVLCAFYVGMVLNDVVCGSACTFKANNMVLDASASSGEIQFESNAAYFKAPSNGNTTATVTIWRD